MSFSHFLYNPYTVRNKDNSSCIRSLLGFAVDNVLCVHISSPFDNFILLNHFFLFSKADSEDEGSDVTLQEMSLDSALELDDGRHDKRQTAGDQQKGFLLWHFYSLSRQAFSLRAQSPPPSP